MWVSILGFSSFAVIGEEKEYRSYPTNSAPVIADYSFTLNDQGEKVFTEFNKQEKINESPLQEIYEIVGSNEKSSFDPERSEQGINFVEVYPERAFKGGNRSKSGISDPVSPHKSP